MSDLSNSIYTLDDNVNVHSTDSTVGVDSEMVDVASTISSSGWIPFPGFLLVIYIIVYYFKRQLIF